MNTDTCLTPVSRKVPQSLQCTSSAAAEVSAKPLSPTPDDEDLVLHQSNSSPSLITRRLRELVPLFDFIKGTVECVSPERTVLSVPLVDAAMNQNGTQQGSIFYLLSEYALGVGMFAALPGIYAKAFHDRCHALPVQCWLKRSAVQHLAPGTGRVRAVVGIPPEKIVQLRQQLLAKGRCEGTETVRIYQDDQLVATADPVVGMYVDLPRSTTSRRSAIQTENLKTSALLIAGLRQDSVSRLVAEGRGQAIARRMAAVSPQLPTVIQARTRHLERYLSGPGRGHEQVVVLGVGLDPKPVQFSRADQRWFGLDLPDMLRDRESRFSAAGATAENFVAVPADLRRPDWEEALLAAGFRPGASTLIVAEGISMYLSGDDLGSTLSRLGTLCSNAQSCAWIDHVTRRMFQLDVPSVRDFLATMNRLGEPFVLGFDQVEDLPMEGWRTRETVLASKVLGLTDAVHAEYRFSLLDLERAGSHSMNQPNV